MKTLPLDATDDQIVGLCREWIEMLAEERVEGALALLAAPEHLNESQHWTPDTLRTYIGNYGSWEPHLSGQVFRVTSPATASAEAGSANPNGYSYVYRLTADPKSGSVCIQLPLDGVWSDLEAQFEFTPVEGGTGLFLYDLLVP